MSEQNDGGPAFPAPICEEDWLAGMTLRDYFAAKAMQGLILNETEDGAIGTDNVESALAELSYRIADAMLTKRSAA